MSGRFGGEDIGQRTREDTGEGGGQSDDGDMRGRLACWRCSCAPPFRSQRYYDSADVVDVRLAGPRDEEESGCQQPHGSVGDK